MLSIFLQGVLLGFGACVPIGPINILIISYALKSYRHAFALGLGAMCADVLYLAFLLFGLLYIFEIQIVKKSLAIFGFIFLLIIAFMLLKNGDKHFNLKKNLEFKGLFLTFAKGFFLTMLNPYTIGFWLSIASLALINSNTNALILGIILSIFSWISLMPYFVWKNKRFISPKISKYLAFIVGIVLIFFAFGLLYSIFLKDILWT